MKTFLCIVGVIAIFVYCIRDLNKMMDVPVPGEEKGEKDEDRDSPS